MFDGLNKIWASYSRERIPRGQCVVPWCCRVGFQGHGQAEYMHEKKKNFW